MNIEHQFFPLNIISLKYDPSWKTQLFNSPVKDSSRLSNICHRYISFVVSVLVLWAIPGKVAPGVTLVTSAGESRGVRKYWLTVCLLWLFSWWLVLAWGTGPSYGRLFCKKKNIKKGFNSDKSNLEPPSPPRSPKPPLDGASSGGPLSLPLS